MTIGNFITSLTIKKNAIPWTVFHILLGGAATFSRFFLIIWFYWVLVDAFISFLKIKRESRGLFIAQLIIYICSFELLGRMVSASPFIPYELGKYLFLILCLLGFSVNFRDKNNLHNLIVILGFLFIIPAFFIDKSGMVTFRDIVFNVFGLINIFVGILFFNTLKVDLTHFVNWLKPMAFPCIAILVSTYIRTPDLDEIEFVLGANFQSAGNFGSNQVATVLGLGAFIFGVGLLLKFRITGSLVLDLFFFFAFLVQGLLTFSRGGMIGTAISIAAILFYLYRLPKKKRFELKLGNPVKFIIPVILVIVISAVTTNILTDGNLFLRYMGETAGTLAGTKDKDLNQLTTNRFDIFMGDIELYQDNPVFGVGAAASKYLRSSHNGVVAHVELSRLIAEHGLFSIFILVALFSVFYLNLKKIKDPISKGLIVSFAILSVYTTFHAATRTFLSPLLLAMATAVILPEIKPKKTKLES